MNQLIYKTIGEICDVNPKKNGAELLAPSTEVSFVPMSALDETFGEITGAETKSLDDIGLSYTPFCENDVLFAKITPCMENGKVAIARHLKNGVGFGSTEFHVLRSKKDVKPEWVFAFVRRPIFREQAKASFTGTAGQQRVPADFIKQTLIPVPPLSEQKRIIRILDEADHLRRLRAEADRRADDLIPGLFYETFGDPLSNRLKWPVLPLRELSEKFSDGPFGSNLKSEHYTAHGIRVVRLQNIGFGSFIDEDKAFISENHFSSISKHECLPGDVIVGTLGEPNLRACLLPNSIPRAINKADCVQIRARKDMATAEYLCWLLNIPATLHMAAGLVMGQTRSRISMGRLSMLSVPVPPIKLQQDFAVRVAEIQSLRAKQNDRAQHLEMLFQSLLSKAFQGDL